MAEKVKVFLSYSHHPPENVEFVRGLVQRLNSVIFGEIELDTWLDEERIAGGADVQDTLRAAVSASDAAVFVVNSRWTERERTWIRHEVMLLGDRPKTRLVVLLREPVDGAALDHTFTTLKRLEWFPDDPEPDARFWEVFCGIVGMAQGPHSLWSQKGREISAQPQGGRKGGDPLPSAAPVKVNLQGKPIRCFPAEDATYLVTEDGEWGSVAGDRKPRAAIHAACHYALATLGVGNELLLAGYDGTLARYSGKSWKILSQQSAVLCFAATLNDTFAGTMSGHILCMERDGVKTIFQMRDPVASLAGYDDGLLMIGSRGTFGRLELPAPPGAAMEWISTEELGRPVEFFQAVESSQVGLQSGTRVGVLEPRTGRLTICPRIFDEGVRSVSFLGAQTWPYVVLTDAGTLTLIDAAMAGTRTVRFPRGTHVSQCASAIGHAAVLAWTQDGMLYTVSPYGTAEHIAGDNVVLAYESAMGEIEAVRWTEGEGTTLQTVRSN